MLEWGVGNQKGTLKLVETRPVLTICFLTALMHHTALKHTIQLFTPLKQHGVYEM